MKKIALILILALCCPVFGAWAEPEAAPTPTPLETSAGSFWESLGHTWNAFVDMANETGNVVTQWVDGASKDVSRFIDENMPELGRWMGEAGQYFEENVSPEITAAWNTLADSAAKLQSYSSAELERAYAELKSWMNINNADDEVRQAVEHVAEAAGIDEAGADGGAAE